MHASKVCASRVTKPLSSSTVVGDSWVRAGLTTHAPHRAMCTGGAGNRASVLPFPNCFRFPFHPLMRFNEGCGAVGRVLCFYPKLRPNCAVPASSLHGQIGSGDFDAAPQSENRGHLEFLYALDLALNAFVAVTAAVLPLKRQRLVDAAQERSRRKVCHHMSLDAHLAALLHILACARSKNLSCNSP